LIWNAYRSSKIVLIYLWGRVILPELIYHLVVATALKRPFLFKMAVFAYPRAFWP
jgi:hypothetical protein